MKPDKDFYIHTPRQTVFAWPGLLKSVLTVFTYERHKIFCYKSDKYSGFEKLTFEYETIHKNHQKADGVLRTSIPFRTCLPAELGAW